MISMREMARRKKGIEAICQMAKAMRLVSTVRFQQLRDRAEKAERSFDLLRRTMADLAEAVEQTHPYLDGGKTAARGAVFITADRGMAGGYTTALIRCLAKEGWSPEMSRLWTVGKKGAVLLSRRGFEISGAPSNGMRPWETADALAGKLLGAYRAGEIGEIHLFFSRRIQFFYQLFIRVSLV